MKFFITRNVALVGLVTMMFGACANMAHKGGDDMAGPPVRASRSGGSSRDGKLGVLNNDGILHNIHVFDEEGKTLFNFAQPGFKKQIEKPLPDSKIINIKCDVHDWMNAYIIVLKNAIYTVTDEKGRYRLEGLPPGPQKIRIWHAGLGSSSKEVVVETGQVAFLDFIIGK